METISPNRELAVEKTLAAQDMYFQGDVEGSLKLYREANELCGDQDAIATMNVGIALIHIGSFDESFEWLERAYKLKPEDRRTRTAYGEALFREGRWTEAWQHWFPVVENPFTGGGEQYSGQDLNGKEVLVTPAGGYGDIFMLARYIPELARRFKCKVSFAPIEDIVPLFIRQPSMAGVNMTEKRNWEIWMHLFDFPKLFQMSPDTVLWNGPYIESIPMPDEVTSAAAPRIGIKFGAGEKGDAFRFRSVPGIIGTDFLEELAAKVELVPLTASNSLVNNWIDTIALISSCDLVLSVDTSVLHLSAAMGKETWAILGDFNDAKWGKAGSQTPWYPTMTLFRGSGKGYQHSLDQVTGALHEWFNAHDKIRCAESQLLSCTQRKMSSASPTLV